MEKFEPGKENVVMSREEVRGFDSWAINTLGVPGVVLMENAGRGCAEFIKEKLAGVQRPKVCIFCGTGNNGGDGYVISRHLLNSGFSVAVVICGERERVKGDARVNLDILEKSGRRVEELNPCGDEIAKQVGSFAAGANMVVDGLFGTGLKGELGDEYKQLIGAINGLDCPILAVDIPSGLDCDSGKPHGTSIRADYTVTFVAVKKGFTVGQAAEYTGEIFVASIGVQPSK